MYTEIKIEMSSQVSFHAKRNQSFSFILGLNNDVLIAEQKKTNMIDTLHLQVTETEVCYWR